MMCEELRYISSLLRSFPGRPYIPHVVYYPTSTKVSLAQPFDGLVLSAERIRQVWI